MWQNDKNSREEQEHDDRKQRQQRTSTGTNGAVTCWLGFMQTVMSFPVESNAFNMNMCYLEQLRL